MYMVRINWDNMRRAPSIVGGRQQTFEKWMPFLVLLLIFSSLGIQTKQPAATHKRKSSKHTVMDWVYVVSADIDLKTKKPLLNRLHVGNFHPEHCTRAGVVWQEVFYSGIEEDTRNEPFPGYSGVIADFDWPPRDFFSQNGLRVIDSYAPTS